MTSDKSDNKISIKVASLDASFEWTFYLKVVFTSSLAAVTHRAGASGAMIAVNCRSGKSCSMLSNYASMAIVKPAPGVVWTTCTGGSVTQLLPGITESACFSIPGLLLKNENVAIEQCNTVSDQKSIGLTF